MEGEVETNEEKNSMIVCFQFYFHLSEPPFKEHVSLFGPSNTFSTTRIYGEAQVIGKKTKVERNMTVISSTL